MADLIFIKTETVINSKDLIVKKKTTQDGKGYLFVNKIEAGVEILAPIESVEIKDGGIVFKDIPESWRDKLSKFSDKP